MPTASQEAHDRQIGTDRKAWNSGDDLHLRQPELGDEYVRDLLC
jgi:hypothetical protein